MGVSLYLASFPNEFSWGCEFADGVCILSDLQLNFWHKVCHTSRVLIPPAKIGYHENAFGELARRIESPPIIQRGGWRYLGDNYSMNAWILKGNDIIFPCNEVRLVYICPMSSNLVCNHYNDVIMSALASQIISVSIVCSTVEIKENIKAPRHWPLCGEFTGTGEFLVQMASNAENVSIWWRHHAKASACLHTLHANHWRHL